MKTFKLLKKYNSQYDLEDDSLGLIDNFLFFANYTDEKDRTWLFENYDNIKCKQVSFSNYNYKHLIKYYMLNPEIIIRDIEFDYIEKNSLVEDISNELYSCIIESKNIRRMNSLLFELNTYDISIEKITITFGRNKYYLYSSGVITSIDDNGFFEDVKSIIKYEVLS